MATRAGYYPVAVVAEAMRIDVASMLRELQLAGVKLHQGGGGWWMPISISRSGLVRFAQVNYPQGGRARAAFLDRVDAHIEKGGK